MSVRKQRQSFPLLSLSSALALWCAGAVASSHPATTERPALQQEAAGPTLVLQPTLVPRTVTVLGSLLAQDDARLSVKVDGRVEKIFVDLGSYVRAGDPIAQLEKTDYELRLKLAQAALGQARARLGLPVDADDAEVDLAQTAGVREARALRDEAKRNRDRIVSLVKSGVLPVAEQETVEANLQVSESKLEAAMQEANNLLAVLRERAVEVEIARQQLKDTTITAPFDGAIRERVTSPGEYLQAGTHIATLVRMNPLRLRIEVPERQANKVRLGQPVRILAQGAAAAIEGQLTRISPSISESNRMLIAEAEIKNDGSLRPGAFVKAEVVVEENNALLVPRSAVYVFAGVEKLYVVDGGKTVEKTVRTGERFGDQVEVISGVKAGQTIMRNATGMSVAPR